jgi:inhibitor of cysteine peptidase
VLALAETHLSVSDRGAAVELRAGDVLVIELAENPTTGYRWEVDTAPAALALDASKFVPPGATRGTPAPAPAAAGAGGRRKVTFRAVAGAAGGTLRLLCRRSWPGQAPAADQFEVTVRVAPP